LSARPSFQRLSEVPAEVEWFKNIRNPSTKRAYENAIKDFMFFTGIKRPEEFRNVTRAHVIAWRDDLGDRLGDRSLIGTTIRHDAVVIRSVLLFILDSSPDLFSNH
jgi:hypothetical protein